jgi:Tfp pilus assembly protein PilE
MKQLTLLSCLLFSTLFCTLNTACVIENIIAEKQTLSSAMPPFSFSTRNYCQKGFCGNTLVQTPYGYKPIKELVEGNIVIDCNGEEKKIVAITKKYVDQHVKLIVDNTPIYSGCDQCYYISPVSIWIPAQRIFPKEKLFNNNNDSCEVTHAELIYKRTWLYCLTVKDHTFSIAPNGLCVHNAEALVLSISSMCLGHVILINPIATTIGATVALSIIANKVYQAYIQQCPHNDKNIALPTNVLLAERSYYTQRTTALETIKQEFLYIKNGLENITALCSTSSTNFTYQFLKQTNTQNTHNQNQPLKISGANEMKLSDNQKKNLRALREIELEHLEQEVSSLQYTLALHADELIKQMNTAYDDYSKAQEQISIAIDMWNNSHDKINDSVALQTYKEDLLGEHLLNNFNQKFNELKMVAQYYTSCTNAMCVEKSTNIIALLKKIVPVITEYEQWVAIEKDRITKNITIVEKHFARRGSSIINPKDEIKNHLAKWRNDHNAHAIAEAKNKLASIAVSGGPNKNNNKNDDDEKTKDFWENLKSRSDKNARSTRFGKMYRDPITKLWWSRDLAGHGGSSYKVFKENAKGFEWAYDAVKDGTRMLNKHKGPTGLFIPYKEVIFKT